MDAAVGVRHVYTKDPSTPQWTRVTDPDAIDAFLNRPDGSVLDGWTIYTTDPDVDILRTVLAFQFERSFAPADVQDLMEVLLEHPGAGAIVTLRERLQMLRATPGPSPRASERLEYDDRVH